MYTVKIDYQHFNALSEYSLQKYLHNTIQLLDKIDACPKSMAKKKEREKYYFNVNDIILLPITVLQKYALGKKEINKPIDYLVLSRLV